MSPLTWSSRMPTPEPPFCLPLVWHVLVLVYLYFSSKNPALPSRIREFSWNRRKKTGECWWLHRAGTLLECIVFTLYYCCWVCGIIFFAVLSFFCYSNISPKHPNRTPYQSLSPPRSLPPFFLQPHAVIALVSSLLPLSSDGIHPKP